MVTKEQMKRSLKRIPDSKDRRDYRLSIVVPFELPLRSSLAKYMTHVEDQTVLGSCTAQTGTSTVECQRRYNKLFDIDLSALFHYYTERMILGTENEDSGAEMRNICEAGKKYGFCPDSMWPYITRNLTKKPPLACFDEALKIKVSRYERLLSAAEIKTCIARGRDCAMLGFPVYSNFFDIGSNGLMKMPGKYDSYEGGHAVTVYSYNPDGMWIRNSWGADWGKNGDFFMPWAFYEKYKKDIDVWRIISVKG
jgi:C1A family cysteine protease